MSEFLIRFCKLYFDTFHPPCDLIIAYGGKKQRSMNFWNKSRNSMMGFSFVVMRDALNLLNQDEEKIAKEVYIEMLNDYFDK